MSAESDFPKPGDRVLVFPIDTMDEEKREMTIYGTGLYEGDFAPPEDDVAGGDLVIELDDDAGSIEDLRVEGGREIDFNLEPPSLNPRIRLDSGDIIWGYEAFFVHERSIDGTSFLENAASRGYSVRVIDINQERARWANLNTPEAQN